MKYDVFNNLLRITEPRKIEEIELNDISRKQIVIFFDFMEECRSNYLSDRKIAILTFSDLMVKIEYIAQDYYCINNIRTPITFPIMINHCGEEVSDNKTPLGAFAWKSLRILQRTHEYLNNFIAEKNTEEKQSHKYDYPSFKSKLDVDELTEICNQIIEADFIGNETNSKYFVNAFQGKNVIEPIRWTGKTNQLTYFIKELNGKAIENLGKSIWSTTQHVFFNAENKKYEISDLRHNNKRPKQQIEKLDSIIKDMINTTKEKD